MPIFRSITLYTAAYGVVAEVLRSWCVVLCTVCKFVSKKMFMNKALVTRVSTQLCCVSYVDLETIQ